MADFLYDVVVTDAAQRVALEIVRSLGMNKLKIVTVEKHNNSAAPLAAFSRYSSDFLKVPNYTGKEFIELCSKAETVFPVSTNTVIECCKSVKKKFPEKFLLPDYELLNKVNDKHSLCRIAEEANIAYPKTFSVSNVDELFDAAENMTYPLVLKLANDEGLFLPPCERYAIVEERDKLINYFKRLKKFGKRIILQNYINGVGIGFSVVYDKDKHCLVAFQHQRLREYPLSGGPSTYCKSVHYDIVEKKGRELLDFLEWTGPAMVEFKYDIDKDKLVLLEVNPRYWGSLPLARKAGVNIPFIHYKNIVDGETDSPAEYKNNVKLKFLAADFIAAFKQIKSENAYFTGPFKYSSEFFRPKTSFGIWEFRDPKPAFFYLTSHLSSKKRRE